MAGIFLGQNALRLQYRDFASGSLAGTSDITTAVSWFRTRQECKIVLFKNDINVDISLAVVHPEADAGVVANRLFLLEIGNQSTLNFDISGSVGLAVEAGTSFFVWQSGIGAPAAGTKLRVIAWG